MKTSYFLCLIVCLNFSYSQFKIKQYNTSNGLPHDLTYQLIEDKEGYVWFGTDNGLVKYDGKNFDVFDQLKGLNSNFIIDVIELKNKKKVIATWGGGLYFLGDEKENQKLPKSNSFDKVNKVIAVDNEFYVSDNKLMLQKYKLKNDKYEVTLRHFYYDKNNVLKTSYGTKNITPLWYQMKKIKNQVYFFSNIASDGIKGLYQLDSKMTPKMCFNFLEKFYIKDINHFDNKYYALTNSSVITFNEKQIINIKPLLFKNFNALQFWENKKYLVFLTEDKKTKQQKIVVQDKSNNNISELSGIKFNNSPISDVLLSTISNAIFISTYGSGIYKLTPEVDAFKELFFKEENIFDFKSDEQYNYFLSVNNLYITDKKFKLLKRIFEKDCYRFVKNLSDTIQVKSVTDKQNIYKFNNKIISFDYNKKDFILFDSTKYQIGDIHIIAKNGKKDTIDFKKATPYSKQLKIVKIIMHNNLMWFATNQGLYVFNKKTEKTVKKNRQKEGLNSTILNDINSYNNTVWFSTNSHLYEIDHNYKITSYNYTQQFNDYINSFTITNDGKIWLATQKGFAFFYKKKFFKYGSDSGYKSSFTDKIIARDNDLILLGNRGVTVLNQNVNIIQNKPIFNIIANYNIEKNKIEITSIDSLKIKPIVLDYLELGHIIEFKLNNGNWTQFKNQEFITKNLDNGKFNLQFRARFLNSDFEYSKTLLIVKKPVWYFRWYSFLIGITLLVLFIYFFVNWRLRNLKQRNLKLQNAIHENELLQEKLEEMRKDVAQDFHDELGNKIAGIYLISERLMQNANSESGEIFPLAKRINKDSQELFNGIRDFIWAIDSKNDTLDELRFNLTDSGEELFSNSAITFKVTNTITTDAIKLPLYWNRQLLLLFKEAMTNAFKHSKATQLNLIFRLENEYLIIECQDNGIGFQKEKLKRQNGLLNLQKRANKLKSDLITNSSSGTTITFKGKIK